MVKFKKGDLVICTDESGYRYPIISEMAVIKNARRDGADVDLLSSKFRELHYWNDLYFTRDEIKSVPLNNKLNKRLYPSWVEYKEYLVPQETVDKLTSKSS